MEHFNKLFAINVNEHVEKKDDLSYLSWAWAWAETLKVYPDANYEIERFNGLPYVFDPITGYIVYTRVTIEGVTRQMWLPVMDGSNKAMKAEPYTYIKRMKQNGAWVDVKRTVAAATMFDINKTIMRCLTKNLAMFGLGLYIYAGEDLPESELGDETPTPAEAVEQPRQRTAQSQPQPSSSQLAHMDIEDALSFSMRRGKHAGTPFKDVPTDYLRWVAENYSDKPTKAAAAAVLKHNKKQETEAAEIVAGAVQSGEQLSYLGNVSDDDIPF